MNAQTGRSMDLIAHVRQSIADILFTRIGSRGRCLRAHSDRLR